MNWNMMLNSRNSRRMARRHMPRRNESQAGGGGQGGQQSNPDNSSGNSQQSGSDANQQPNNDGQSFDFDGFWNEPKADENNNSNQPNDPKSGNKEGNGDDSSNFGKQLSERIEAFKFDDVFTTDIANEIADGNLEGSNKQMTAMSRESIKQSVAMSAHVMQQFGNQLMGQIEAKIQEAFGTRDNSTTLEREFPAAAKDPVLKPMIQSVFDQSMKHSNGNRDKAITLTRDMLKLMGKRGSNDFGTAPKNGSDDVDYNSDSSKSLVDELLGRG